MMDVNRSLAQTPFVLRLPVDLRAELAALATQDDRSLAYTLRRLVRLGLNVEKEQLATKSRDERYKGGRPEA